MLYLIYLGVWMQDKWQTNMGWDFILKDKLLFN